MDNSKLVSMIWQFIRGEMETGDFEHWVYQTDELKALLGNDLYLWCLSIPYHDPHQVWEFRQQLRVVVDGLSPRTCDCLTWTGDQKIPLGWETSLDQFRDRFEVLRKRTPWLSLMKCPECGQHWYTAVDTDGADIFLHRVGEAAVQDILIRDSWPDLFDRLPIFWPDAIWLERFGNESLSDWQARNNPEIKG
jgi:hypothetical protein